MVKARNGIRHSPAVKKKALSLRKKGKTHGEIARTLGISIGSVNLWTKHIVLTFSQKNDIERRRNKRTWSQAERDEVMLRLLPYRTKYTREDLVGKIKDFYDTNRRIPLKKELNAWRIYTAHFRSWNKAIQAAGFDTNPVLFSKKFIATDGHKCDSFTEKIIDEWLYQNDIEHERHMRYGRTKLTADFFIKPDILIEFFGLAGVQRNYDQIIERKKGLAKKLGYQLIEIYPDDIYSKNRLDQLLLPLLK